MANKCVMSRGHWAFFKNFTPSEFKCPCGCEKERVGMDIRLIYILQFIRNIKGSVNVIDGHRCKKFNATLPNAIATSDHLVDKAADIQWSGCEDLEERKAVMEMIAEMPGFKYAYCDGWMRKAGKPGYTYKTSESWRMGKSLHISVD